MKPFTITAKIWRWPGDMGWYFVYVPTDISQILRGVYPRISMIPVTVTVGETTWDTSLFRNNRENNYLISIKKSVRKSENLDRGDEITLQVKLR